MALNCGAKLIQVVLFILNIIFWLIGIAIAIVGIVLLTQENINVYQSVIGKDDPQVFNISIAMIVIGCFMLIIGFAGCYGSLKQNRCLLAIYVVVVFIILCAQVAAVIFAAVAVGKAQDTLKEVLEKMLEAYPPPGSNSTTNRLRDAVDKMQKELKCCGVESKDDWLKYEFYKNQTATVKQKVPPSCESYNIGCRIQINNFLKQHYPVVVGVCIGATFIMALVIILGIILCMSIKGKPEVQYANAPNWHS